MSNGLTFAIMHITKEYNFTKCLPMLRHDLKMSRIKFPEKRLIIDGEIDEKHNCVIDLNNLIKLLAM